MRDIVHTWEDATEPAEREALAQSAYDLAASLAQSPGWAAVQSAIQQQIDDTISDLARSSVDDERNRGIIRSLSHVLEMPERLLRAASSELNKHR